MKKLKVGKKSGLRYFSYEDIQSWGPCYDSSKHIPKDWRGTAIDVLNMPGVSFSDRLWCVLRPEICSEKLMRLAVVWFYRDTLNWVKNPDPQSIEAANVAERFAYGEATEEELETARAEAELSVSPPGESADWAAWLALESSAKAAVAVAESGVAVAAWYAAAFALQSSRYSCHADPMAVKSRGRLPTEARYTAKLISMITIEGLDRSVK